jgi:nanoRNase/pAp phosphatase (c-di-AMP/oligoRNAs hydrolase)
MNESQTVRATRSHELLDVLSAYDRIVIVMHDNPDPDAIASGWGVQTLIEEKLPRAVRLVGGGAVRDVPFGP